MYDEKQSSKTQKKNSISTFRYILKNRYDIQIYGSRK